MSQPDTGSPATDKHGAEISEGDVVEVAYGGQLHALRVHQIEIPPSGPALLRGNVYIAVEAQAARLLEHGPTTVARPSVADHPNEPETTKEPPVETPPPDDSVAGYPAGSAGSGASVADQADHPQETPDVARPSVADRPQEDKPKKTRKGH